MSAIGKWLAIVVAVAAIGVFAVWATSPDPAYNPASFEDEPLAMRIAPFDEAITLAQFNDRDDRVRTMVVTGFEGDPLEWKQPSCWAAITNGSRPA